MARKSKECIQRDNGDSKGKYSINRLRYRIGLDVIAMRSSNLDIRQGEQVRLSYHWRERGRDH